MDYFFGKARGRLGRRLFKSGFEAKLGIDIYADNNSVTDGTAMLQRLAEGVGAFRQEFPGGLSKDGLKSPLKGWEGIEAAFIRQCRDRLPGSLSLQESLFYRIDPVFVNKFIKAFVHVLIEDGGDRF